MEILTSLAELDGDVGTLLGAEAVGVEAGEVLVDLVLGRNLDTLKYFCLLVRNIFKF